MYKVLLADDEAWVVESLKTIVDWEALGYRIIGQAYNGIEALKMIVEHSPDLVFTDIRMPDMNGLELIKKVSDLKLEVLFVVASGYAEFAYAQKAMSYGAIGYCLKPFDDNEIKNCLMKAAASLKKRTEGTEPDLTELMEESESGDNTGLSRVLKERGLEAASGRLTMLASIGRGQIEFWEKARYLAIKSGALKKLYIVQNQPEVDIKAYLEKQLSEELISIGIGSSISDLRNIREAACNAVLSVYGSFITGRKGVFEAREYDYTEINDILKQLKTAVSNRDITLAEELLNRLRKLFSQNTYNIKAVHHVYLIAVTFVFDYLESGNDPYVEDYEHLTAMFKNADEMFDYLIHVIKDSIGVKAGLFSGEIRNETVKELMGYVNSNFNKEISVQSLSNKFFINPNYISRVFKKETGQNFIDYLTRLRVDYASRLLRETRLTVQQISEKTGYNDYFYFTRIFKKATGKTPSQYRSQ